MCRWDDFSVRFAEGVGLVNSSPPESEDAREMFPLRGGSAGELEVRCDGGNGYRVYTELTVIA